MFCLSDCVLPASLELILLPLALKIYGERIPTAPPALLLAQVRQESSWKPTARSPVGAVGLTQFMPATWRWIGASNGLGIGDPSDPKDALLWQAVYMNGIAKRTKAIATYCDRWLFALSGYNGGEGWVQRRQAKTPYASDYVTVSLINPGILPSNQIENQEYPRQIYRGQVRYAEYGSMYCPALHPGVKK